MRNRTHRFWRPWTIARRLTATAFLMVFVLTATGHVTFLVGDLAGSKLFDALRLTDPLAAVEVTLATRAVHETFLLGTVILLATAVLLGPIFCGWLCPVGLALDVWHGIVARVRRLVGLPYTRKPRGNAHAWRFAVLLFCAAFALTSGWPLFQTFSPINGVVWAIVFGVSFAWVFLGGIALLEIVFPRVWCRFVCPLGALYSLFGRFAPLRIRIDREQAGKLQCGLCTSDCPMGIPIMEEFTLRGRTSIDHPACTRCGTCTERCPRTVLRLGFRRRRSAGGNDVPACPLPENVTMPPRP